MAKWVKQVEDSNLPKWLTDNLTNKCDCGGDMENFYNDNGQITFRRCNNPNCPHRLAQKIVSMCELLRVKGVGPETAAKLISMYKLSNQYQAIPYIIKEKPKVDLYTFLRMSFTKGIDTGWSVVSDKCKTLDECFTKYNGQYAFKLKEIEPLLRDGATYVEFLVEEEDIYPVCVQGTVMISGTLRGYPERNQFVALLNTISKGAIKLSVSESKRKTGIMALIQEADSPKRGKAACADENGIPIMTPDQFTQYVMDLVAERLPKKLEEH